MDWTTGLWFKFDDEKVTFLENGPNHSFDIIRESGCSNAVIDGDNSIRTKRKNGANISRGCRSAYSLFYVQRSYLGQYAAMQINRNNSNNNQRDDLISWIESKRKEHENSVSQ